MTPVDHTYKVVPREPPARLGTDRIRLGTDRIGDRTMLRTALAFVGVGLIGLAFGFSAGAIHPSVAQAVACDVNQPYNTDAVTNDGTPSHRGDRAHGTDGGMWVPDLGTSVTCVRVSSLIIVQNGGSDYIEVGWFDASGAPMCHYTGSGGARLLWFAVQNGSKYCATQTPALISGLNQYHGFSVDDPAGDGNWSWAFDGSSFKTSFFNLPSGNITSNGERHGNDIGNAEFKSLQWDSSTGWHDWVNPSNYSRVISDDPNAHNEFFADPTHVKVVQN